MLKYLQICAYLKAINYVVLYSYDLHERSFHGFIKYIFESSFTPVPRSTNPLNSFPFHSTCFFTDISSNIKLQMTLPPDCREAQTFVAYVIAPTHITRRVYATCSKSLPPPTSHPFVFLHKLYRVM